MKIFSNFDTNRKQIAYAEAVEKFWTNEVLVLGKSNLFFAEKVLMPILWRTTMFAILERGLYYVWYDWGILRHAFTRLLILIYIILISPNIKYYLDYTMDFSIFTPETLTRYNQSGFFKRDIKTSNVRNIKTVTIQKNSLRYNIFDNWDLTFLSEWDRANQGEITLHYIQDPESKKKKISQIMKL